MRRVAAVAGARIRDVAIARYVSLLCVLLATVASAAPTVVLALRIANVDMWQLFGALPAVMALCVFAAAIVTICVLLGASRLSAWAIGTVGAAAIAFFMRGSMSVG
jgi:hypothetical protein